jgi:hypothetical protein
MPPEHRICTKGKVVTASGKLTNDSGSILQVRVATIGIVMHKHRLSAPDTFYRPLVCSNTLNIAHTIELLTRPRVKLSSEVTIDLCQWMINHPQCT